jgi:hypothetical protein
LIELEVDARRVDAVADESLVRVVGKGEVASLSSASEELKMSSRIKISGCE